MPLNSRAKGAAGELELRDFLREHGYAEATRGQQFHGGAGSPDVACPGLEDFHLECKRVEKSAIYDWLNQAIRDAGSDKIPIVAHRQNRKEWVAILRLEDLLNLILTKGA